MKAQELRIGNLINYKGEPIIVTMIGKYGIQSDDEDRTVNAKFSTPDLTPIPLTPELLERCGFLKSSFSYSLLGIYFIEPVEDYYVFGERYQGAYAKFHYLHQLQNLYFALTGSEIEIKP